MKLIKKQLITASK